MEENVSGKDADIHELKASVEAIDFLSSIGKLQPVRQLEYSISKKVSSITDCKVSSWKCIGANLSRRCTVSVQYH